MPAADGGLKSRSASGRSPRSRGRRARLEDLQADREARDGDRPQRERSATRAWLGPRARQAVEGRWRLVRAAPSRLATLANSPRTTDHRVRPGSSLGRARRQTLAIDPIGLLDDRPGHIVQVAAPSAHGYGGDLAIAVGRQSGKRWCSIWWLRLPVIMCVNAEPEILPEPSICRRYHSPRVSPRSSRSRRCRCRRGSARR